MNWSLIEGFDRFLLSVIHLEETADSGAILGTEKFDINRYDDIRTLYYKLAITTYRILDRTLESFLRGELEPETQTGEPTYYPKREPEDGGIHWGNSSRNIHNLVRAVSRPYPGAFTEYEGVRVMIWEAQPFSSDLFFDVEPGTIVRVFRTRDEFVVATGDGSLLVTHWDADEWYPERDMRLQSVGERHRVDMPAED